MYYLRKKKFKSGSAKKQIMIKKHSYMKRQQTCKILAAHHNFRDPCCSPKNIKHKGNLIIYLI